MENVYQTYHSRGFEIFLIYTREAHPGEKIPAHTSFEEKLQNACHLRDEEKTTIPILVDTLEGTVHQSYGASEEHNSTCPRLIIIDKQGKIVLKSTWVDSEEVRFALDELIEREVKLAQGYHLKEGRLEKIQFPLRDLPQRKRVLSRAGEKSIDDWEVVYGKIKES